MILIDTGPLVAAAIRRDPHHDACADLMRRKRGELAVPSLVVAQTCYMLDSRAGTDAEAAFLALLDGRVLVPVDLFLEDYRRIADLVLKYADLPLGAVDASVIALAERMGITEIATLDHRHFSVVRPRHVDSFTLLP